MAKKFEVKVEYRDGHIDMTTNCEELSIFEKLGIAKYIEMKYELQAINEMRNSSQDKEEK